MQKKEHVVGLLTKEHDPVPVSDEQYGDLNNENICLMFSKFHGISRICSHYSHGVEASTA